MDSHSLMNGKVRAGGRRRVIASSTTQRLFLNRGDEVPLNKRQAETFLQKWCGSRAA